MSEESTPQAEGLDDQGNPIVDTPGAGDEPGDKGQGNGTPPAVGPDTKLPADFMGGKYETLGEFEKAHKGIQSDHDRMKNAASPGADGGTPAPDPEGDKPLTRAEYKAEKAEEDRLVSENKKFDSAAKGLNLTESQIVAAKAYGNVESNKGKDWPDILVELGHQTQDRVDKARSLGKDEKGNSKILDPSNKTLAEMTPEEVAALPPEKFEKLSNAQAAKEREATQ